MPTTNQRAALLRQTTKEREDRNILSFFVLDISSPLDRAGDPNKEQTSKQASTRAINFKPLAIVNR
tara:strand:+ start:517 stop:714 length:198 start_codon:yes stop_codon:yes gene_type:complete